MEADGRRLLEEARTLVAESWASGAEARDVNGNMVEPWEEQAVSWSLLGAIVAALEREASRNDELPLPELAAALCALARVIEADSLVEWNDRPQQTQGNVVATLDRATAAYDEKDAQVLSLN
jgi:hypothetical protein